VRRVLSFARVFFEEEEEKFSLFLSEKTTREKVEQKNEGRALFGFVGTCARFDDSLPLSLSLSISRKRAHARAREKGCGLCALILKRYTITKNTDTYIYLLPFFSLYELLLGVTCV